jgi:hypothetical protein
MNRSMSLLLSLAALAVPSIASAACPSSMPDALFKTCINEQLASMSATLLGNQQTIADLEATVAAVDLSGYATLSYVDSAIAAVEPGIAGLSDYLSVDADADAVIFSGANVFIQSGSGSTSGSVNGLGNLIVGYDEDGGDDAKTGSHNLVLGQYNSYSGYAGIVGGNDNAISGASASVLGGSDNAASGEASVVLGGSNNTATHASSVVLGGSSTATSADGDVTP